MWFHEICYHFLWLQYAKLYSFFFWKLLYSTSPPLTWLWKKCHRPQFKRWKIIRKESWLPLKMCWRAIILEGCSTQQLPKTLKLFLLQKKRKRKRRKRWMLFPKWLRYWCEFQLVSVHDEVVDNSSHHYYIHFGHNICQTNDASSVINEIRLDINCQMLRMYLVAMTRMLLLSDDLTYFISFFPPLCNTWINSKLLLFVIIATFDVIKQTWGERERKNGAFFYNCRKLADFR